MALGFRQRDPDRDGTLEIEEIHANFVEVYFVPPERSLAAAGLDATQAVRYRTKLLEIDGQDKFLTIYPISTFGNRSGFLKPKYGQIERITLDNTDIVSWADWDAASTMDEVLDVLENLPSTFTKDYAYGLGLAKPYRFIIDAVEELSDCTEVVITGNHATGTDPDNCEIFYISKPDFEQMRLELNKIDNHLQSAGRAVKSTSAHNVLSERMGVPKQDPKTGRHPYRKLFTAVAEGKEELSEEDQNAVIGALTSHAADIAEKQPEKLAKLRGDIELVTLEALITRYEGMLGENLVEGRWQEFFNENPFILNMAFGYPVIKVRDQASVGGRKLSGDGEKITDFLVKNSLTNNTAIFEIKTPQTQVLNKTPFRDGVFTPSADLSGSINQALDQKYQFQKQIAQIKDNSRLYDIESYAVHCCLVIGKTPDGDDRKKSFELFRRNSKDVEIVTFDELLEKLRQLSTFLRATEKAE
ncbi:Shedu immune nuclease family protein [Methyloversatilis discipulorum]|uniref:Shedu immune nuclease family protein n=1 Tax=Methyloversatilis discipulorum TaxID=1119528 RepID=UPI001A48EB3B|nr:Shedu immune nuclease family protein [Methyloversatilis discipulorum]MBL8466318.1 DUF4263 domain-containing protein [Methyloversatilis discipulorum]